MRQLLGLLALVVSGAGAYESVPSPAGSSVLSPATDTVRVAPPTGAAETDRANILVALEEVEPGGTVQFAPGTYLVGKGISVAVPRITLVAHPRGTTIRGCRPEDLANSRYMFDNCWGLELAGRDQTIRRFVFEHAFWALHLGCCIGERIERRAPDGTLVEAPVFRPTAGGYLVEDNVFRSSRSGLRVNGVWEEPAVVRGNRFLNNWHSASIQGGPVHLLDNDISAPEPDRVPFAGVPWDAVSISPGLPRLPASCDGNVIAGNRIEGVPDGIKIQSASPDARCRHNVVRDNTIRLRRVRVPPQTVDELGLDDTTMVMVPMAIRNLSGEALMENNLIEGNRILGAEGLAIEVLGASENRIVDNTISRVLINDRVPETTPLGQPTPWRQANGSAIWLSPGSDQNQILDNTFEDIAGAEVFLEGHDNRVELRSAADSVRDLGTGNRVSVRVPPGQGAPTLRLGHPLSAEIRTDEVHRLRLDLEAGQIFERDGSGTVVGLREIVEDEPREHAARTPPYQAGLAELRAYEGSYRSDELRSTWTFTAEPGRLVGHHERRGSIMNLTPTGPDRFRGNGWAYRHAEFVRDERGRIVAVLFSSERFRDERFERVGPAPELSR